jgi:hypothetical protein
MIRPHHLTLRPNAWGNGVVVSRRFRGLDAVVVVRLSSGKTLYSYQPSTLTFRTGEPVTVVAKPCHSVVFATDERWHDGAHNNHADRDTTPS